MNYLPDEITISLHFTDIQAIDDSLTTDEARQVLELIATTPGVIDIAAWIKYFKSI